MKLKLSLLLLALFLQYGLAPSYAMELEGAFKDGQKFRRNQPVSPIYLQWDKGSSKFQIHSYKTKSQIGFMNAKLDRKRESVDFASFFVDDKSLGAEVFRTLIGVFKASKTKFPAEIKYLSHLCPRDDRETIDSAKEAGFEESLIYSINPSQIYLVKEIPVQEPTLPQNANAKQVPFPVVKSTVIPKPVPLEAPPLLSTLNGLTAFEIGKKYRCNRYSDIYLQYAAEIDVENVVEVPMKDFGFKIFRMHERDEIGYIIPNYQATWHDIRIGAVWINENMRGRGYASKALLTLMAQCVSKRIHFPTANYFSLFTKNENVSMHKAAERSGFGEASREVRRELLTKDQRILLSLFGKLFVMPFDKGK